MADVNEAAYELPKSRTGIEGFDEITGGGLPAGRPTLVAGGAGAGKTLFAMEFLVNGATQFNEPGVFVSFEESVEDLTKNVASMGIRLDELEKQGKIEMDHVHIERSQILETGEYNLDGLFVRLACAIDSIGAKRVVLDTLESLFSGFPNQAILRSEIRRLFGWLREKGVTAVVTAEKGDQGITRHGLEEYTSDCVIFLDHRLQGQVATRSL
ncbi:MAG: ATPase domain-containing protein, partial [Acidobacteriota bacterium]